MRDSRGFTLVELLLVLVIIGILMTIAMTSYRQARLHAAETSAIAALSAINQAQYAYMQTCGNQRFAPHLTALGKANPSTNAPYLSPDLTGADEVVKSGYKIVMTGTEVTEPIRTCTGDTPVTSYQITADPLTLGITGRRYFGTNRDLVIYESVEETFTERMPEVGAPTMGQESKGLIR